MKWRLASFRARIFFVSLLVVAVTLAVVAGLSWTSAMSYEIDRLDARLCEEAHQLATRPLPPSGLARVERDAALKLRLQSAEQLLLWVQAAPEAPAIRSARWPDTLSPNGLTWVAAPDRKPPSGQADVLGPPADDADDDDRPPPGQVRGPAEGLRPPPGARREPPDAGGPRRPPRMQCRVAGFSALASDWRAAQVTASGSNAVVGADLASTRTELRDALGSIVWRAAPLALLLTALGAWLMSTLAMRPVTRLRSTMEAVNQQSLEHRVPVGREDHEFQDLINAYNRMLDRLEASFHQATRFSADAAHELRTPLTILQGQIEQAMRVSGDQPIQVQLAQMLDEAGRLSSITRKLLILSQADAGKLALLRTPVDLSAMLQERLADANLLELRDVRISSDLAAHAVVQGDEQLLGQVLNNLCGNAFKYTHPGGWIHVQARAAASGVEVLWSNSTHPIAPPARARMFDRFFRGDAAHNRNVDGHGLGLSLARVIAQAHGGDVTLLPSPHDEVRLRLWLPVS